MFLSDPVEADLRQRVAQCPNSPAANNNLGVYLRQQGRFEDAKEWLQAAFWLDQKSADIAFNFALTLMDLRESAGAEFALRRAVAIRPHWADANRLLARAVQSLARWDEAEALFRLSISQEPEGARGYKALGDLLNLRRRFAEAEIAYRHTLTLDPNAVHAYSGLTIVLFHLNRLAEAETYGRYALAHFPDTPPVKSMLALILLKLGQYREGWMLMESRFEPSEKWDTENYFFAYPRMGETADKRWTGESLVGKALVVVHDQGLGDAIQFARFMPMLKALGPSRLAVACDPALARLLNYVDGIDEVLDASQMAETPQHDVWCYIMSAAHHLGITLDTLPADSPYIRLPQELVDQWRKVLNERVSCDKPRVGLVWAGSRGLGNPRPGRNMEVDNHRSLALKDLHGLLSLRDVEFVSLQRGPSEAELAQLPAEFRLTNMMDGVIDLADTAAIIQNLDLVITVDTGLAHLAGALGKPVWIMSRFDADWRWLVDREDSPWYPSARVFRQEFSGDWGGVIGRVERELGRFVG